MKSAVQCQRPCGQARIARRTTSFKPKERYSTYIYRKLKQVHPDRGCVEVVQRSPSLEQVAAEAARLSLYTKRRTMTSEEVCNALRNSVHAQ